MLVYADSEMTPLSSRSEREVNIALGDNQRDNSRVPQGRWRCRLSPLTVLSSLAQEPQSVTAGLANELEMRDHASCFATTIQFFKVVVFLVSSNLTFYYIPDTLIFDQQLSLTAALSI